MMHPMWSTFELLLIAGTIAGSSIGKLSDKPKNEETRLGIIDGQKVPITKYPFMVAIAEDPYIPQGSGVILNENYILTTGFMSDLIGTMRVGSNKWNKGGHVIKTSSFLIHPNYTREHWSNNVALFKTQEPIKFNKKVQPVEIGTKKLKTGTTGTVVGWGDTHRYADPSKALREAENTVSNFHDCNVTYTPDVDHTNFCSKAQEAGPCVGDYGDPFLVDGKVFGLYAGGYDCTNLTRVYVDIPALADWILENIGQ